MRIANIYFNIAVNGFDITNFIAPEDLKYFDLVETAGASLPYVYVQFATQNELIVQAVQLGNTFRITIGNSPENADTFEIECVQPSKPKNIPSNNGWLVEIAGFIGPKAYIVEQASKGYYGNSLEVCEKVIDSYFGKKEGKANVLTDFSGIHENKLYWRRTNKTGCFFVADTLLHTDVRPSFPLFAFDKYKNFYIKDFNELLKEGPKYIFSPKKINCNILDA